MINQFLADGPVARPLKFQYLHGQTVFRIKYDDNLKIIYTMKNAFYRFAIQRALGRIFNRNPIYPNTLCWSLE